MRSSVVRMIFILALSSYVIFVGVSDLWRIEQPIGVVGTIADGDAVVRVVAPGSPAAKVGIVAGDRFDLRTLSPQQRWWLFPSNCIPAGQSITVGIFHGAHDRRVTMTSIPERIGTAEKAAIWMEVATGLIIVASRRRSSSIASSTFVSC